MIVDVSLDSSGIVIEINVRLRRWFRQSRPVQQSDEPGLD